MSMESAQYQYDMQEPDDFDGYCEVCGMLEGLDDDGLCEVCGEKVAQEIKADQERQEL